MADVHAQALTSMFRITHSYNILATALPPIPMPPPRPAHARALAATRHAQVYFLGRCCTPMLQFTGIVGYTVQHVL